MDDAEFFDTLYQQWSKTTGAKDTYWMPEHDEHYFDGGPGVWLIKAVNAEKDETDFVGSVHSEADADFICGLHGAVPDLIRHLGEATDKAERMDERRDQAENDLADALLENSALEQRLDVALEDVDYYKEKYMEGL